MTANRRAFLTAAMTTGAAATAVAVLPNRAEADMGYEPTRAELAARIDDLLERVIVLETGGPPKHANPVMGATTGLYSEWPALEDAVGTLLARRSFQPGFVADFRTSNAFVDVAAGRWSWWSFKIGGDYLGFVSGAWDNRITDLIATIPAGHRTTMIMQHEPENDPGIVAADWCAAQARLGRLVREAGRPELDVAFVLMDWTFNPQSGRDAQAWFNQDMYNSGIRVIGIDAYQPYGFLGGTHWDDWAITQARFTPVAASWGVHIAMTEYACAEYPGQPMRKTDWYRDVHAWAVENDVAALHTFNYADGYGLTESHLITSSESCRDEYARQVGLDD
jgi:hypothetical protein